MLATRRPRSWRTRRCNTVTECSSLRRAATRARPIYPVPPMTRQFMLLSLRGSISETALIVIFQTEMSDQIFTAHPPERVLQLHQLNEDVVLRVESGRGHGRLEVERQPLLDAPHSGALRQIQEQHQVQYNRRRQDRIAAQEIDLDLHRIAEPTENVDVVPAFLGVAARRIVVNPDGVVKILVQLGIKAGLENLIEHAQLSLFLGFERAGVLQNLPVTVSEDVRGKPSMETQHSRFQAGSHKGLHERLAGLEVLAAYREIAPASQFQKSRCIRSQVGSAIGERHAALQRGVSIDL